MVFFVSHFLSKDNRSIQCYNDSNLSIRVFISYLCILPLQNSITTQSVLQYQVNVALSSKAATVATWVELALLLPNGVELQAVNSDYVMCDISNLLTIICSMTDISLEQANSLSHTVGIDVELTDVGLLLLTFGATVNRYSLCRRKRFSI